MIFDGFEPLSSAPHCHDEHDLALPPNGALEAAPASASTLNSEPTAPIKDGRLDATSGAATPTVIEPSTSPVLYETRDSKEPDSSPDSATALARILSDLYKGEEEEFLHIKPRDGFSMYNPPEWVSRHSFPYFTYFSVLC